MNKQQVFDKVLNGLRKQGCISVNDAGVCMYRGAGGMKCGIGMLISDEHYYEGLEEEGVIEPRVVEALSLSGVIAEEEDMALLNKLQCKLHDHYSTELQRDDNIEEYPAWLEQQAKDLAATFDLDYSEAAL